MSSPSVLRPETKVTLGGSEVTVREISGLDALEFFSLLGKHAKDVVASCFTIGADNKVNVDVGALLVRLQELVFSVTELSTFLLERSTGDADVMKKHGTMQCLALLDAALEVNLTDEHIELAKKVGGRVGRFLTAEKNDTPKSATS